MNTVNCASLTTKLLKAEKVLNEKSLKDLNSKIK